MARKDYAKTIGKVIAQAWRDDEFKQRLLASPVKVLREAGLDLPKGWRIRVVQDTPKLKHIVLPVKPPGVKEDEMEDHGGVQCSARD